MRLAIFMILILLFWWLWTPCRKKVKKRRRQILPKIAVYLSLTKIYLGVNLFFWIKSSNLLIWFKININTIQCNLTKADPSPDLAECLLKTLLYTWMLITYSIGFLSVSFISHANTSKYKAFSIQSILWVNPDWFSVLCQSPHLVVS